MNPNISIKFPDTGTSEQYKHVSLVIVNGKCEIGQAYLQLQTLC